MEKEKLILSRQKLISLLNHRVLMAYVLESNETWKLHIEHILFSFLVRNSSLNELVRAHVK